MGGRDEEEGRENKRWDKERIEGIREGEKCEREGRREGKSVRTDL